MCKQHKYNTKERRYSVWFKRIEQYEWNMLRNGMRVHIPQRTTKRRNSNNETTSYSSWQCENEISLVYIKHSILFVLYWRDSYWQRVWVTLNSSVEGCGMVQSTCSICGGFVGMFGIALNIVLYSVTSPFDVDCFLSSFEWACWLYVNETDSRYINMCMMMLCTIGCRNIALYVHRAKPSIGDSLCIAAVTSVFWYVVSGASIERLTQREWFENSQVAMSGSLCCSLSTRRWPSK